MFYFRTLSTIGPSFGEPSPAARVGCFSLLAALLFPGLSSQPCPPMLSWMKGLLRDPSSLAAGPECGLRAGILAFLRGHYWFSLIGIASQSSPQGSPLYKVLNAHQKRSDAENIIVTATLYCMSL